MKTALPIALILLATPAAATEIKLNPHCQAILDSLSPPVATPIAAPAVEPPARLTTVGHHPRRHPRMYHAAQHSPTTRRPRQPRMLTAFFRRG